MDRKARPAADCKPKGIAEELERSRRTLATAERIARFGVWEMDLPHGELRWSPGLYEILGFDPATHIPSFDLFRTVLLPAEHAQMAHKLTLMLAGDGQFSSDDFMIVRPDGEERSVHIETAFERDTAGQPLRVIGTIQDVTESRRAQVELQRSYRSLADAERIGKFGTWDADPKTKEMRWSAGLYRILGLDPRRDPPDPEIFAALLPPDTRARVMSNMERLFAGDVQVLSDDYAIIRPDGTERFIHGEAGVKKDEAGQIERVIGSIQDITEGYAARLEAERSRHMLLEAERIAGMGSYVINVSTGEMDWSRGLYELFGLDFTKQTPSIELFSSLVHPDDRPVVQRRADALWAGDVDQQILDWRFHGKDRLFHAEFKAEKDQSGRLIRVFGTVQDVTEQRKTERVLQKALESAQAADRAKSEFLTNMSHELRTPLNAIIGFADVLLADFAADVSSETRREYLQDIRASGQHLLDIINGILSLSKIEAGQGALDEEVFALRDVIAWTLRLVRERARTSGVSLGVRVEADLPQLRADRRLVRQALLNLVSNAVKFTRAGGWVVVRANWNADGDIEISVSDSGIGMRPEDLPVALAPFRQLDGSLARKFEGTGLGLPLAKKFVELHGGELAIESEPGQGTTVTITLPRARALSPRAPLFSEN